MKNFLKAIGTVIAVLVCTYITIRAYVTERRGLEAVADTLADVAEWFKEPGTRANAVTHSDVKIWTSDNGGMSQTLVDFKATVRAEVELPVVVDAVVVFLDRDGDAVHRAAFEYTMTQRSASQSWVGYIPLGVFQYTTEVNVLAIEVRPLAK